MNTTPTIDNSGAFPVIAGTDSSTTSAYTPVASTTAASTTAVASTTGASELESIMRKMADQQSTIDNLSAQLQTKSDDVAKLSQKQRDEMMHVYQTVIKGWVDAQESVDPKTRSEFNNGIERLAENADDNGIW